MESKALTDYCPMPFGKHKGEDMEDVPASWLIWFWGENETKYRNNELKPQQQRVCAYIEDNMEVLQVEIKRAKDARN